MAARFQNVCFTSTENNSGVINNDSGVHYAGSEDVCAFEQDTIQSTVGAILRKSEQPRGYSGE